jgi:hypothetical protein
MEEAMEVDALNLAIANSREDGHPSTAVASTSQIQLPRRTPLAPEVRATLPEAIANHLERNIHEAELQLELAYALTDPDATRNSVRDEVMAVLAAAGTESRLVRRWTMELGIIWSQVKTMQRAVRGGSVLGSEFGG